MLDIIDATGANDHLPLEIPPVTVEPQKELGEAITSLWTAHQTAKGAARATRDELRALRIKLGERLSEMKEMLAKPGCAGQWSGFLREHQIPRATADRLVTRHERALNPDANCATEEISEPTEEDVRKLFATVWPKLRRTLRSRQSVDLFVHVLTSHCENAELAVHENPAVMPAAVTFDPPPSDGDSSVEPEFCSDRATICAS